ncbi:MAG: transposase [Caldilineaceae bacterium]|nr:transposase [Caldilineaceae bacterium]
MARSRYKIIDNHTPYFLTATVVNWIPLFGSRHVQQILIDSLRFLQTEGRLCLYAFVIMENHLHLVASSADLSKEIGNFKSYTARRIIDYYQQENARNVLDQLALYKKTYKQDREHQLWQEGSHPQRIADLAMMRQKVEYIHNNPVKRGWVDNPVDWRYSSARNYAGIEGVLDVQTVW